MANNNRNGILPLHYQPLPPLYDPIENLAIDELPETEYDTILSSIG